MTRHKHRHLGPLLPPSLCFSEEPWESVESAWAAWWASELERTLVVLECIDPEYESTLHCAGTFLGNYPLDLPPDDVLGLFVPRLGATHYLGDAFPRFWPDFGPGIVAAFAGAKAHSFRILPGSHPTMPDPSASCT